MDAYDTELLEKRTEEGVEIEVRGLLPSPEPEPEVETKPKAKRGRPKGSKNKKKASKKGGEEAVAAAVVPSAPAPVFPVKEAVECDEDHPDAKLVLSLEDALFACAACAVLGTVAGAVIMYSLSGK